MKKTPPAWITISEEPSSAHCTGSDSVFPKFSPLVSSAENSTSDTVKNKWFWGVGFVLLMFFTTALLAPAELAALLKGNLFGDYKGIELLPPFPGSQAEQAAEQEAQEAEAQSNPQDQSQSVVSAQTDAVAVQVDPVEFDTEPLQPSSQASSESDDSVLPSQEAAVVPQQPLPEAEPPASSAQEQSLIEQLTQQLAEFKKKDEESTKALQGLASLSQPPTSLLHSAPPDLSSYGLASATPSSPASSAAFQGYKPNLHRVSLTPQQVLSKNLSQYASAPLPQVHSSLQASQASVGHLQASIAPATPASGPMLALWATLSFALMIGVRFFRRA